MKISIVLGRGVEGCGVTKYTAELEWWLQENKHFPIIYADKSKKWSRNDVHGLINLVHVNFGKDEFEEVYEGCKSSDLIIFNSLPSVNHNKKSQDGFSKLLDLDVRKVLIQHDHNKSSLRRNALLEESFQKSDVLFAHSTTGDFADIVNTPNLFDPTQRTINLMQPGINFEWYRDNYWKPIWSQDHKHHKWIGRTVSWKGYDLMMKFHDELMKIDHLTTFEGIDRSPAYMDFKSKYKFYDELKSNVDDIDLDDRYGKVASVFGQYINIELLERMSLCTYGYQLSKLKPKYIAHSLEFTHLEPVAVGAIPVFRKEYGDVCIHRHYGKPLTELDSGTIWLTDNNMDECISTIKELSNNESMRNEYRELAYKCYSWYDSKYVFGDMFKIIDQQ